MSLSDVVQDKERKRVMPGPVSCVAWARLPNDLVAPIGADTEIIRFPAILDPGTPRLIRLCISGGLLASSTGQSITQNTVLKTIGLIKPLPQTYYNTAIEPPPITQASGTVTFTGLPPGSNISAGQVCTRDYGSPNEVVYGNQSGPMNENNGIISATFRCNLGGEVGNCPAGASFGAFISGAVGLQTGVAEPPGMTGGRPPPPPTFSPYTSSSPTEFVASVSGGQRDFIVWINPSSQALTLCGVNGGASDYAWQAVLEDLGPST